MAAIIRPAICFATGDFALLIEVRDYAACRAHWLIQEEDGFSCGKASDLVVVYDLHDIFHVQLVYCLSHLVVINQDDLLVSGVGELLWVGNLEVIQQELGLAVDVACGCSDDLFIPRAFLRLA